MTRKPDTLLLLAADARERLEAAAAFLEKHSGREPLVLAPTRGAADDLLREALVLGGGDGYFGVSRATLPQAAAEIAAGELARRGLSPVSGLALEALAARTVDLCRGNLTYLGPVEDTPGLPRALLRTLGELRGAGVSREMLQACGSCGADLASLLGCFEGQLADAGLCDPPAMYRIAAGVAGGSRLGGRPILALDVTPGTLAEEELLAALVEASPAVLAVAPLGEEEAEACWTRLLAGAVERRPSVGPSRLARLRRHLFEAATEVAPREDFVGAGLRARPLQGGHGGPPLHQGVAVEASGAQDSFEASTEAIGPVPTGHIGPPLHQGLPSVDSGGPDDTFDLFAAPGEGREAVEIARRILEIGRAGGGFDQVAVALREPDLYWPLIEEALGRAGIPSFFTQGSRRPDPAGRAFLALLACAAESLSASRFAEYLSLGQVPPLDEEGVLPPLAEVPWVEPRGDQLVLASPAPETTAPEAALPAGGRALRTPRRWERWLVDAAVIAGADRWRRRLEGIEREILLQIGDLEDGDADERRRLLEDREDIAGLRRFALPVVETLAGLPRRARWGTWLPALEGLAARVLASPERVLAVLAELRPMAEVGPVGLGEVRRVLEERLTLLRTPPEGRRWGKVFVCRLDELRGRAFEHVFLPGLADGLFPRKVFEDPLLLDARRDELEAAGGPRLARTVDLLRRERALLRLAVQAAKGRLVASYPSLDSLAGRARVPSFYALDLLRAAEGELPDLRALEKRAAEASQSLLGWPAPRRAEAAIDDAEFDLATLAELLRSPAGTRRGAARFLLETSAPLRRSLRNRFSRWTSTKLGPADGLVAAAGEAGDGLRAAMAEARLGRRPYSPTALEQYAACPLRFAYRAILGLRPRDRIERLERLEQLDPATRGALFHRVQFLLQGRLAREGLLPLRPPGLETAEKLLDEVLGAAAAEAEDQLAPAIPRVFAGAIERMRLDLRGWLRALAAADDGFAPLHRELAFGLSGEAAADHDPASRDDSVEIVIEGLPFHLHLRGSIDLVEGRGPLPPAPLSADGEGGEPIWDLHLPVVASSDATTGASPDSNPHPGGVPEGSRWLRPSEDATTGAFPDSNPHPGGVPEGSRWLRPSSDATTGGGTPSLGSPPSPSAERGAGGRGPAFLEIRVTDHKTGKPPEKRYLQIGGGEKLQPILYALAAEKLLGRPVASGRLFYCTRRGGYRVLEVRLDDASRKAIGEVLATLESAIEDAFLPAWPRQDACSTCDFLPICGPHEEKRIRRKKGERLKPLEQLRGRP